MSKILFAAAVLGLGALGLISAPAPAQAGLTSAGGNIAERGQMAGVIKTAQRHNRRAFRRSARHNRRATRRSFRPSNSFARRASRPGRRIIRRSVRPNHSFARRAYRPGRRTIRRYVRHNRPVVRRHYRAGRHWRYRPRGNRYWPRWSYGYYGLGAAVGGVYIANRYACDDYYDYAQATGSAFWWRQYDICTGNY